MPEVHIRRNRGVRRGDDARLLSRYTRVFVTVYKFCFRHLFLHFDFCDKTIIEQQRQSIN